MASENDYTGRARTTAVDESLVADGHEREHAKAPEATATTTTAAETADDVVLEVAGVSKSFGGERAVDDVSISVRDGELLTLVGPSGCGKTTTLRLIAGLDRPDAGEIRLDGKCVAGADGQFVPAEDRDVGIVFQEFALFPHLTVAENVGFGLADWSARRRRERTAELLELVELAERGDAYPEELSGGEKQRVALARSLAPNPEVLLLDEPFSNLDVGLRVEMREEVRRILKQAGVTAVSVTHDQEEALSISDRVAVVHDGRVEQLGAPEQVFQHPQSRFVAEFLGHTSFLPGVVAGETVETPVGSLERRQLHGLTAAYDGSEVDVMVRPDDMRVRPAAGSDPDGTVVYRRYLGPTVMYRVALEDGPVIEATHNHAEDVSLDTPVDVDLAADHELAWFPKTEDGDTSGGA